MKKIVLIGIITVILVAAGIAIAKGVERNPTTVVPSGETVIVPDQATDNSPVLEKAVFIHYRKGFGKPGLCGNKVLDKGEQCDLGDLETYGCPEGYTCNTKCRCVAEEGAGGKEKGPKCYGFLSKGAKLKSVKDLTVHPNLDVSVISNSASEWDSNTSTTLFGNCTSDETANWDSETPDGRNEFSYGNYPQEGVIAVAIVWGYFSGPPKTREIVEFDVMFDTDYTWGNAGPTSETEIGDTSVMDLQNIATHEIGHGVGLDDAYEEFCSAVTMYGYSDYGETNKRTLEQPDITGLQTLYGI